MTDRILVANAPCSFGAFEMTVGVQDDLPEPADVLDHIAASGYDGTDLGPLGWLGVGEELREALSSRGLGLAGGYLELPFTRPERMDEAIRELDRLLDVFDAAAPPGDGFRPKPTLADQGSPERLANPGRAQFDRDLGLDEEGWKVLAEGVTRALERCRERGYEPTFHHHTTSHIEAPWEIERLLERTDVGMCLDTGHLMVGGGDPIAALGDWGSRINHVHIKDCRLDVVRAIVDERAPSDEIWHRHAFCRLGAGDLDLDALLEGLRAMSFAGWVVVEQDGILNESWTAQEAFRDQSENREYLRSHGL